MSFESQIQIQIQFYLATDGFNPRLFFLGAVDTDYKQIFNITYLQLYKRYFIQNNQMNS